MLTCKYSHETVVMKQLLFLLCVLIIVIMGLLLYKKLYTTNEGFEAKVKEGLSSCPLNMTSYYDNNDNPSCCDGKVEGNACISVIGSNRTCVRGMAKNGKPSCRDVLLDYYKDRAAEVCPNNASNYYEGPNGIKGCSAEPLATDLKGPVAKGSGKPTCLIYKTEEENQMKMDSCQNHKLLEDVDCRGVNCVKSMSIVPNSPVPLVLVQFTDQDGGRHSCYTDDTYASHKASLKTAATISENPLQLCSIAYAKFLDRKEI